MLLKNTLKCTNITNSEKTYLMSFKNVSVIYFSAVLFLFFSYYSHHVLDKICWSKYFIVFNAYSSWTSISKK